MFREWPLDFDHYDLEEPKIIQAVSRQGVSGNELEMRPQFEDHSDRLVQ